MEAQLFVHSTRPEWGRAVITSQGADRREYQFEDGKVRVIRQDFFRLMEPVTGAADESVAKSERRLRLLARDVGSDTSSTPSTTLPDQIALFRAHFPKGFEDPAYRQALRSAKNTKRAHVDPWIEQASEILTPQDRPSFSSVRDLLRKTDLLSTRERKALADVDDDRGAHLEPAIARLLTRTEPFVGRYKAWLRHLDEAELPITWALSTAIPALASPDVHVAVRPSAFRMQSKVLLKTSLPSTPDLASYELMQRMAITVRDALRDCGVPPRDLFDVRAFMWLTLRSQAGPKMEKMARA